LAEPSDAAGWELGFAEGLPLGDAAEVALEDYARAVTSATGATALRAGAPPGAVVAVRLAGLSRVPGSAAQRDIEDFARRLAAEGGAGLGWS
jgi:hypothetical protein